MRGPPLAVQDRYVSWSHLPALPASKRKVDGMGAEEEGGQPSCHVIQGHSFVTFSSPQKIEETQ